MHKSSAAAAAAEIDKKLSYRRETARRLRICLSRRAK